MNFFETLQHNTQAQRQQLLSLPIIQAALRGDIHQAQYVAFLTQAYHHVKHTVPLLMACGAALPEKHNWLRVALAHYIEEEIGHEEWVLNDLAACGADKESIRRATPHFSTEMMVAYAYHQMDRGNPLGFLGMVHVLEGTSIALATAAAAVIKQQLRLPDQAFSYLNSHGNLDLEHVQFFESLINQILDASEQAIITASAQRFYWLYGNIFKSLPSKEQAQASAHHPSAHHSSANEAHQRGQHG